MKTRISFLLTLALFAVTVRLQAQGTGFTYQGRLNTGTNPATGTYDLTFSLYGVSSGGSSLAGPVNTTGVGVTNGLFTVLVDFGAGVFTGGSNWLSIGVRTNGGGAFTPLTPREQVTPAPYAIFAESASAAGLSGTIPAADLTGVNGSGLTGVNAATLGGLGASSFWQLTGNALGAGQFLGSLNSQPLFIQASGGVGIGTPSPADPLDLAGQNNWNLGGGSEGDFRIGNPTYRLKMGVATGGGGAGDCRIYAAGGTSRLVLGSSTKDVLTVLGTSVGIGTLTPSQALEVNGNYVLIDGAAAYDGNGPIDAYIGGNGSGSDVQIGSMNSLITSVGFWNYTASAWMHIACSSITINGGSDLAEPFTITSGKEEVPQGAVVVIDKKNPGQLKMSDQPYDRRVAGVVSGANGIKPGIQMQQQGLLEGGKNVALTGRVYVLADASNGPIEPGDLLTTSSAPGQAMKVTDHARAQGAILGKAMTGLSEGNGMVLVLVALQ